MSDELDDNVELYPAWRQALVRFLDAGFTPDQVVPHEWWWEALGIEKPDEQTPLGEADPARLQWVDQFGKLRAVLLERYLIALKNEAGQGYRIVAPRDQSRIGFDDGTALISRGFRLMFDWATHTNMSALTADERRAHTDNMVRIASLGSLLRRTRKLPTLD
jgi:hypothetical protein